jgi:hypothetical protein
MRARVLVIATAAFVLTACGGRQQAASDAGLQGTVLLTPATPVCAVGSTCSKAAAHVTLTFTRNDHATTAQTDSHGRYRIALAPGRYSVSVGHGRIGRGVQPRSATVRTGGFGELNFRYDSGIR